MDSNTHGPSIYPVLKYKDAEGAIRFLSEAFGFDEHDVHRDPGGTVAHAELAVGDGIIMMGTRSDDGSPFDLGPACVYVAVDDPDEHHDRAVAAGVDVVMGLTDHPYGSREYAARDPEGNLWCFGTYRASTTA